MTFTLNKVLGLAMALLLAAAGFLGVSMASAPEAKASVDGYQVVAAWRDYPASTWSSRIVSCPTGKVAVGGGWYNGGTAGDMTIMMDGPNYGGSAADWVVGAQNHTSGIKSLQLYVICADA